MNTQNQDELSTEEKQAMFEALWMEHVYSMYSAEGLSIKDFVQWSAQHKTKKEKQEEADLIKRGQELKMQGYKLKSESRRTHAFDTPDRKDYIYAKCLSSGYIAMTESWRWWCMIKVD